MTSEAITGDNLPYKISGAADLARWRTFFGPKADLTYRLIENVQFDTVNLQQSLFTGTILRDCQFRNVDFARSDLDGMRLEQCTFIDCNLYNADIRSTDFVKVDLVNTSMRGVYLSDCTFESCRLDAVSFDDVAVSECTFRGSELIDCAMQNSTWTLNRFERTSFVRMILGDCTFLFAIMLGCTLKEVSINAESVGMVYGITPQDLRNVRYIYLGEDQGVPEGLDVNHIFEFYRARRWIIGIAMLRLNAGLTSVAFALREYFDELFRQMEQGGPLRSDELRFVMAVLEQLRAEGRLPLLTVMDLVERIVRVSGAEQPRIRSTLQKIAGPSHLLLTGMLGELETKRIHFAEEYDEPAILRATFNERPRVPLSKVMNEVAAAAQLGSGLPTQMVRSNSGSYVEVVATALSSVAAFQAFLYLVNGCLIQITVMRARVEVLKQKRLPTRWQDLARDPAAVPPAPYVDAIERVRRLALRFPFIPDVSLGGYAADNVRELELLPRESELGSTVQEKTEKP